MMHTRKRERVESIPVGKESGWVEKCARIFCHLPAKLPGSEEVKKAKTGEEGGERPPWMGARRASESALVGRHIGDVQLRRYAYGRRPYGTPPYAVLRADLFAQPPVCGRRRRGAGLISAAVTRGRRIQVVPIWVVAGMHTGGPGMHTGAIDIPGITDPSRLRSRDGPAREVSQEILSGRLDVSRRRKQSQHSPRGG